MLSLCPTLISCDFAAWSEEEELFFEEGEDAGQQLQHDSFYGIGYLGEEQREGIDYPET